MKEEEVWKMDFFPGVIVTPQGVGEKIVGIVVDGSDGAGMKPATVVWFSDRRGVFVCTEAPQDLNPGWMMERDEITDQKLSHYEVARVLRELVNPKDLFL